MLSIQRLYRRLLFGRDVIVVSGLPRSGTSMMMRMLAAGGMSVWSDGIRTPDDQNPLGYYELERVKDLERGGDTRWLRHARGRAIKVVSSLLQHLPATNNYQVLFMNRDIAEILASQSAMLTHLGQRSASTDEALAKAYETHLRQVKAILSRSAIFRAVDLNYRDALRDPRQFATSVETFLHRNLDVAAMAAVVDEALYRNRR